MHLSSLHFFLVTHINPATWDYKDTTSRLRHDTHHSDSQALESQAGLVDNES